MTLNKAVFVLALAQISTSAYAEKLAEPIYPHSHIHAPGEINEEQGPFIVDVTYTFDIWRAAKGGAQKGSRYIDNLDIVAEADMERLVGWDGAMVHIYGVYNNGKSLTELVGDAQAASNIETGTRAVRLYEAWLDQKIGDAGSIKVGLYDLNSEFDALDSAGLFMGSAHGIGTDISQTGLNGPSIFPSTSLAARLAWQSKSGWAIRTAILDAVPGDPQRPKKTVIDLDDQEGALLIGEIEAPLPQGKLLFGHWTYTARFDKFSGLSARGNNGWYLRGEHKLSSESGDTGQGLTAFARAGCSPSAPMAQI